MLEFEIWKASSMLFQPIPYGGSDTLNEDFDRNWDDNWHKIFAGNIAPEPGPNTSDCETYHTASSNLERIKENLKRIGATLDETNKITPFH